MFNYVIRRLLLMIPTFLGATLLVFVILQMAPGGPLEKTIMQIQMGSAMGGGGEGGATSNGSSTRGRRMRPGSCCMYTRRGSAYAACSLLKSPKQR